MIDTDQLRKYIDRHGPPLSPMLIFTLLDEIDRLRALIESSRNTCSRAGGCVPRD
jgi:hypothetical protein